MLNGSVNALHIALAAAVVGWLVFSLSHSVAVWRKRNTNGTSGRRLGLLWAALLLCCIGLVGGWLNRELARRAGVIAGTDFFVVRAHAGSTAHLTDASSVSAGASLVTYDAPEAERQEARLQGEVAVLDQQRNVKALQPVVLNPELLRRSQQEADTQRARLTQLGFGLLDAPAGGQRTSGEDLLQAERAKNDAAQLQLQRTAALVAEGVWSRDKLDAATAAAHASAADLHDRQQLITAAKAGSAELARSQAAIGLDGQRANAERSAELAELAAQSTQLRNDLSLLQSEQSVSAPFSGTVVYRRPSPALAGEGQVILALARGAGFVATIQVPAREAGMLSIGQALAMKLDHSLVSEEVSGRLASARPSAATGDRVDLQIECNLPTEQFSAFADGSVPVTLEWRPALWSDRFAQAGFGLAGLLVSIWMLSQVRFGFRRSSALIEPRPGEMDRVLAQLDRSVEVAGVAR